MAHDTLGLKIFRWYREVTNPAIGEVYDKTYTDVKPMPERCRLILPSMTPPSLRKRLGFTELMSAEYDLWEGAVYDSIAEVRLRASSVAYMDEMRQYNNRGVQRLTRSLWELTNARGTQELCIRHYNAHRKALITLWDPQQAPFPYPEMDLSDTYRKSRTLKRALGDSRRMDGMVFGNLIKGKTLAQPGTSAPGYLASRDVEFAGMQITCKKGIQGDGPISSCMF